MEELTDRELAILRTLPGSATQREIGAALYLSLNTIKAYNKTSTANSASTRVRMRSSSPVSWG
jgi:DNA-binding NarL/FixJ family response regulator